MMRFICTLVLFLQAAGNFTTSSDSEWFNIQVVRETRDGKPDGLTEHNAANFIGEASFLGNHQHTSAYLELHCVQVLKVARVTAFKASTTGSHEHFADYASCQRPLNSGPTTPYKCAAINDADCHWLGLSAAECSAARAPEAVKLSTQFVGLGVTQRPEGEFEIYSFPGISQCRGSDSIGTNGCAWKITATKGLHLPKQGMTAAELEHAFASAPGAFSCGSPTPPPAPTPPRRRPWSHSWGADHELEE